MPVFAPIITAAEYPDQDWILLAGRKSPGRARFVKPAGSPRNWDVRQGYGFSGAYCVFTGAGLAKFTVAIDLWDATQFQEWASFAALLEVPKKYPPTKGLGFQHPLTDLPPLRLRSVVIEDVRQFEVSEEGLFTSEIDFLQYAPPKRVLQKPTQDIPGVSRDAPPGAATEAERIMQQNREEIRRLGG